MDKVERVLPYVLLVAFLTFSSFKTPEIAHSVIIIALCALSGYRAYLNSQKQDNYIEIFRKELKEKEKRLNDLESSIGMYNIAQKRKEQAESQIW